MTKMTTITVVTDDALANHLIYPKKGTWGRHQGRALQRLVLSPPLVHSSSDHQALNTEDNNPPQSNYAQQRPKFRRNSFRAFLLKARNGDTAGWHFGWLAIKSGFEKGQNSRGRQRQAQWLMRLEGLAPTYSVASALGESDSIKNQRFPPNSADACFLHQPFQCQDWPF